MKQSWIRREERQADYRAEQIVENCYRARNYQNLPDSVVWGQEVLGRNTEEEKVVEYLHF